MKRSISLLLIFALLAALVACNTGDIVELDSDSLSGGATESAETTGAETSDISETESETAAKTTESASETTETESKTAESATENTETEPETTISASETTETGSATTETETESEPETETTTESETETKAEDVMEKVDFIVSVPEGKEPVVLHLTDPQIIDPSQQRYDGRLSSSLAAYWATDRKNEHCYDYLSEIITATKPDLIIITGDILYGEFDDNGQNLLEFISFMESFNIPWAPVFGNHDNESYKGIDWQCEQLEAAKNCLFLQRTLTGNGNYTVGIEQGGKLTRVFFMLDSNGCTAAEGVNSHTKTTAGFGRDQISWYTDLATEITRLSPDTRLSMAFHIQLAAFRNAFSKYSVGGSYTNTFIDRVEGRDETDFGYIGAGIKGEWDSDYSVWNSIKALGFDSIFVGHEHSNSASIMCEGVRLQYGMKCSTYDRNNYFNDNGDVDLNQYSSTKTPWIGGSVFSLDAMGEIKNPYIYYCTELPLPAPKEPEPESKATPHDFAFVKNEGADKSTYSYICSCEECGGKTLYSKTFVNSVHFFDITASYTTTAGGTTSSLEKFCEDGVTFVRAAKTGEVMTTTITTGDLAVTVGTRIYMKYRVAMGCKANNEFRVDIYYNGTRLSGNTISAGDMAMREGWVVGQIDVTSLLNKKFGSIPASAKMEIVITHTDSVDIAYIVSDNGHNNIRAAMIGDGADQDPYYYNQDQYFGYYATGKKRGPNGENLGN